MSEILSVRLPTPDLKELQRLSVEEGKKKSELLREVIHRGLRQQRLEFALEKFRNKEATAAKAARLAGIPLTAFLDFLQERGVDFHYTEKELEEEFQAL